MMRLCQLFQRSHLLDLPRNQGSIDQPALFQRSHLLDLPRNQGSIDDDHVSLESECRSLRGLIDACVG